MSPNMSLRSDPCLQKCPQGATQTHYDEKATKTKNSTKNVVKTVKCTEDIGLTPRNDRESSKHTKKTKTTKMKYSSKTVIKTV